MNKIIDVVTTKEDVKLHLQSLGIQKGMLVLVDAAIHNFGYISGGAQAIIEALMEIVGYEGTIIMPSFTMEHMDPSCKSKYRIEREHWEYIRQNPMAFHRKLSAPTSQDALVHQFMRNEAIARSCHPLYSFVAWGKYAKLLCDKHPLHFGLSKDSPLGKIVDLNGYVLLLGCDYKECTMFHLARYHGEQLPIKIVSAAIQQNKQVVWKDMLDLELINDDFAVIGEAMEERKVVKTSYLGTGRCRFFSAREAVRIASAYFNIQ
ncbi:MAG: AAC(3) family N-acetyltransferase [Erysipelotrichaceae bacterium]|nr:AAC(3) family N-acetyltransferase [Erysipelotrichaceae bacterium]